VKHRRLAPVPAPGGRLGPGAADASLGPPSTRTSRGASSPLGRGHHGGVITEGFDGDPAEAAPGDGVSARTSERSSRRSSSRSCPALGPSADHRSTSVPPFGRGAPSKDGRDDAHRVAPTPPRRPKLELLRRAGSAVEAALREHQVEQHGHVDQRLNVPGLYTSHPVDLAISSGKLLVAAQALSFERSPGAQVQRDISATAFILENIGRSFSSASK
jgi:hypothetical protein